MDFLSSGGVPSHVKYILYMDAFDTLLMKDASKVVEAFLSYDADVVAAGTQSNYPNIDVDLMKRDELG